jgi:hypothetical protein
MPHQTQWFTCDTIIGRLTNRADQTQQCVEAEVARLTKERDKALAEVARIKSGGCARDQRTTQFCAEAVALQERVNRLEEALTNLVVELDAYLRPWNQPQKDPANKAKRLDLAEDAARFEIKAKEAKP